MNNSLKSKKEIKSLFTQGKSLKAFPLILQFMPNEENQFRIGFSVSKRKFKRAVHRNRIKRLMREAYLQNKEAIETRFEGYNIFFIYVGQEIPNLTVVNKCVEKALNKKS